jgi:hypothetical protein
MACRMRLAFFCQFGRSVAIQSMHRHQYWPSEDFIPPILKRVVAASIRLVINPAADSDLIEE